MSSDDLKVWFPVKRGLLRKTVGHIKAVDGVSVSVRQEKRWVLSENPDQARLRWASALLRLISSDGPIVFLGNNIQGLRFKQMRPIRRDMQIVFQDPFWSAQPAYVGWRYRG